MTVPEQPAVIDENLLAEVAVPTAIFLSLSLLASQADTIGDIEPDDFAALNRWPLDARAGILRDMHNAAEELLAWTQNALTVIVAAEADL